MNPLKKLAVVGGIVAVLGGFIGISSWMQSASDPRNNPARTWTNAKETCERMIEEEEGQRARSIRSDVFEPSIDTYKMSVWVQYSPENKLYNCRLLWDKNEWDVDLFERR